MNPSKKNQLPRFRVDKILSFLIYVMFVNTTY